jgi:hypothetical protein
MAAISRGTIMSMLGSDFSHFAELPSEGASGGILIAWKHCLGPAADVRVGNHCLSIQFQPSDGHAWWFAGVHGPQGDANKLLFLEELRNLRAACRVPWLVMGDFNLIISAEDKNNENLNRSMMGRFHRLINDLNPQSWTEPCVLHIGTRCSPIISYRVQPQMVRTIAHFCSDLMPLNL